MYRRQGFTLVEVLFVLVIIAAIMAYAVPSYRRTKDRAAYEAATGILVDVGSAIQAMKKDLTMQGFNFSLYPLPATAANYKEIVGNETVSDSDVNGKILKEILTTSTAATRDARFVGGLFKFGYLEPFTPKGYHYYAIRGTTATACNNKCRTTGTVACMCKTSLDNSDCYYGAVFLNTGKIQPIEGSSCRS